MGRVHPQYTPVERHQLTALQKARRLNLDSSKYGVFAEIGAGQEIARWFFQVGGAAGTVAKTISAYDMRVSDAIYGRCTRYVCRERLLCMLDYEYRLLLKRLNRARGQETTFFVIADTVAARSYSRSDDGSAWLGVRFQHAIGAKPSQILLHVRLHDIENLRQQEAIGILGVNLLYGAFFSRPRPEALLDSILDELNHERVEINLAEFSGPAFPGVDNRLVALHLLREGFTLATVFTADGKVLQVGELIYNRPLLILRGGFRPVTNPVLEMMTQARSARIFARGQQPVELFEISLHDLHRRRTIRLQDFLLRVDFLRALGKTVLLSGVGPYHLLPAFLRRYTNGRIAFLMGLPSLREIFATKHYKGLPGGLLQGMGQLFNQDVRLAIYPVWSDRRLLSLDDFRPPKDHAGLYQQLRKSGHLVPVHHAPAAKATPLPDQVLAMIRCGDSAWRRFVPRPVAQLIRKHKAFGFRPGAKR